MSKNIVQVRNIRIGDPKEELVLIAGPCVIESEMSTLKHAEKLKKICTELKIPLIFKSSYDKANRTSVNSYRGPGIDTGLRILAKVKKELDLPVLSDVHCRNEVEIASMVLDVIQIPAFLVRQTDLVLEAARTNIPINIKKAQFLAPWDMKNVISKIHRAGNKKILLTERGYMFGYNNLVSDMRALQIMAEYGYPVIYDVTHSIQLPGSFGKTSGGQRKFADGLARSAVAMGCDAVFIEVHETPEKAMSDAKNMIYLSNLKPLLSQLKDINTIIKDKAKKYAGESNDQKSKRSSKN